AILLIAPQTGGSLNPARTFGPYLGLAIFGGSVPWSDLGVYIIGPLVGGIAAVLLYDFIAETRVAASPARDESCTPAPAEDS
ncbi:MAG TPA: aquaporin, partial [Nocardioidaceae bacterium]